MCWINIVSWAPKWVTSILRFSGWNLISGFPRVLCTLLFSGVPTARIKNSCGRTGYSQHRRHDETSRNIRTRSKARKVFVIFVTARKAQTTASKTEHDILLLANETVMLVCETRTTDARLWKLTPVVYRHNTYICKKEHE